MPAYNRGCAITLASPALAFCNTLMRNANVARARPGHAAMPCRATAVLIMLLALIAAVQIMPSQALADSASPPLFPVIGIVGKDFNAYWTKKAQIRVNDMPISLAMTQSIAGSLKTALSSYVKIHPYFLKQGINRLSILAPADSEARKETAAVVLAVDDFDYAEERYDRTLLKMPPMGQARSAPLVRTFPFHGKVPIWSWTHGRRITNSPETKQSLFLAYQALADRLTKLYGGKQSALFVNELTASMKEFISACELRGEPYRELAHMVRLAERHGDRYPGALTQQEIPPLAEVEMELFGGDTLARMKSEDVPLLRWMGGAYDASHGHQGPTDIPFEVWFRLDEHGQWVVDAIMQSVEGRRGYHSFVD